MTLDPRRLHIAVPGFYKMKLVKGGIEVPVRVWQTGDRDPETGEPVEDIHTFIQIDGRDVPYDRTDAEAERINLHATPIDRAEYEFMMADATWARAHAPEDPKARPREAVDVGKMKPVF